MKVIFTRNNLPLSRFITWGLNEPVSHMAIVFDDCLVFHSNFKGLHIEWYDTFKKSNEITYQVEIPLGLESEEAIYKKLISLYDGLSYDYGALFYLIYRGLGSRFLGRPMPTENKWASNNKYMCIEVLSILNITLDTTLDLSSPYKVYNLLKQRYELKV